MQQIKTTHNGHEIVYSENEDVWRCWNLNVEAKTLSAVKTKINKIDAAARRVNTQAWLLPRYSVPVLVPVTMIEDDKHVWIVENERGVTRRRKVHIEELVPDTEEGRAGLERLKEARRVAKAAEKAREDIEKELPRHTRASLQQTGTPVGEE